MKFNLALYALLSIAFLGLVVFIPIPPENTPGHILVFRLSIAMCLLLSTVFIMLFTWELKTALMVNEE